ncbi:MAG: LysR family transcriptional regulator [Rhodospirillaceae bacterium]|nr:LysR family transcriptional regulator [Rhodospirillaceae bacterium]
MTRTADLIPATTVLIKFECVGRLGSLTLAAQELRTSVSSVSRGMTLLENQVGVPLLERSGNAMRLTEAGRRYHDGVSAALGQLRSGAEEALDLGRGPSVVVACSHDASHLLFMPRYGELERRLGEHARIRLLTYQRHIHELQPVDMADVVLSWQAADAPPEDRVVCFREAVQPICSPAYLAEHEPILRDPAADWARLTLLDLKRPNMGWVTWEDWFDRVGRSVSAPQFEDYDTYTQILEAAAAGRGVALGWKHCVEAYLDRRALVAPHGRFEPFGGCYVARLTAKGRRNPLARRCLEFFGDFA